MKTKLIRETDVLREICQSLTKMNVFFWRSNNIPVFGRSMPKYSMKGMSDICGVWDGTFFAIEVKRPALNKREPNGRMVRGGKLSMSQAEFGHKVLMNGGEYVTAYSLMDVHNLFLDIAAKKGKDIAIPDYAKTK